MSIDHPPRPIPSRMETLSLTDQLRVRTATIIDEIGKEYVDPTGGRTIAQWSDPNPAADERITLTSQKEMSSPESMNYRYKLRIISKSRPTVKAVYEYDSFFPQISKSVAARDGAKRRRCSDEDIAQMLAYLETAPIGMADELNDSFVKLMQENDIHDPRFHMQLKRFAANALGRFRR